MHERSCSNDVSFNYQVGDCCAAKIIAERNTTPFVKFEEKKFSSVQPLLALVPGVIQPADRAMVAAARVDLATDSSPPPLFLLHSSLLI